MKDSFKKFTPAEIGEQAAKKEVYQRRMKIIEATLTNDETSTDQELIDYFMEEVGLDHREAIDVVSRRNDYLKVQMVVQTVITNTLYAGKRKQNLCQSCSNHLEEIIQCNAEYCHCVCSFKALGNWHEGICEEHSYHQNCLDRQFRHK